MLRGWRRRLLLLPLLLAAISLSGCNEILGWGGDVEIRIRNASTHDFTSVIVTFPEQTEDYGPVPAASVSGYRKVGRAYSYASIDVILEDGTELSIQATDYSGERRLGSGHYTYQLGVSGQSLTSHLVIEDED